MALRWPHGVNSARPEQGWVGAISETILDLSDSTADAARRSSAYRYDIIAMRRSPHLIW